MQEKESPTVYVDLKNYPRNLQVIDAEIAGELKQIPVYCWREDSHHDAIAKDLASGKRGVVFGVGNYGWVKAVGDSRRGRSYESGRPFFTDKEGRAPYSKVPIYAHFKYWERYADLRKIHPEFRSLFKYESLKRFYKSAIICHIIVPTFDKAPYLDETTFVTTREDWVASGKPDHLWCGAKTVSLFWWSDPDAQAVADRVASLDPTLIIGITSFNDHAEKPAWRLEDVLNYIRNKGRMPFDFVVQDVVGEAVGVKSSHPQFQVPLKGQEPKWTVIRKGSVSVEKFLAATGLPFETQETEATTIAARDHPEEKNLDDLVEEVDKKVRESWIQRRREKSLLGKLGWPV